ncbi:bifunctional folylpolyglutamate synthase/dihydrofolate synthase [Rothia sp. AR01]|uniref:tetrahydrofolate synthase n=1 Tax=Rothia santali TaxID=2949643 RepID=A0A9X2HCK4_9MICC|nr:folylpolyglutamate synthase/dihydrofolate synthase family protein [Rothia santali]MCP3425790.1 bifunctional folylpolyglutamate synthase/dihydrofolate synthase [Rothia santali]
MDAQFSAESVYAELRGRAPESQMAPRLDAMRLAMDFLGDPAHAAPVIHLTGTNGKTSTARMVERLLMAHDLRPGRYTSPHLSRVTERISVDGEPVDAETFVRTWDEIRPFVLMVDERLEAAGEVPLTEFEAMTALAFAVFANAPVDVVVLEVGLGGTWDATNVADAAVSVVTPIDLDHTGMLGETVEEIATEKAGIIKDGGFLVSAVQQPGVAEILLDAARAHDAPFRFEGVEFGVTDRVPGVGGQVIAVQGIAGTYRDLALPLFGAHQAENASLAIAAVEAFLGGGERPLSEELVRAGLEEVTSPGRLEVAGTDPTVVLDAAHNVHGITASAAAVLESFQAKRLDLVVGILDDKDALSMFEVMRERYAESTEFDARLYVTASTSPRAIPAERLAELALAAGFDEDDVEVHERLDDALSAAVQDAASGDDLDGAVLVTGSITVVGEARTLLGL